MNLNFEELQMLVDRLSVNSVKPVKIYPIGQKVYRVLDDGSIDTQKVGGYELTISDSLAVTVRHVNALSKWDKYVSLPGENYAPRVEGWYFDRKSANQAAGPLLHQERLRRIDWKRKQIDELTIELQELQTKK